MFSQTTIINFLWNQSEFDIRTTEWFTEWRNMDSNKLLPLEQVADLVRDMSDARPLWAKISSLLCSVWEKLAK